MIIDVTRCNVMTYRSHMCARRYIRDASDTHAGARREGDEPDSYQCTRVQQHTADMSRDYHNRYTQCPGKMYITAIIYFNV